MSKIIVEKYENIDNKVLLPPLLIEIILETEEVTIEDVEDGDGVQLEQLVTNTIRGFRRSDPSKPADTNKGPVLKPTFAAVTANKSVANNQNNQQLQTLLSLFQ